MSSKTFIRIVEYWVPECQRRPAGVRRRPVRQGRQLCRHHPAPVFRPRRRPARPGLGPGPPGHAQAVPGLVLPAHRGRRRRRPDLRHRDADLRRRHADRRDGVLLRRRRRPCRRDRAVGQPADPLQGHAPGRRLLRQHRRHLRVRLAQHQLSPGQRPAGHGLGPAEAGVPGKPGQGLGLSARRQRRQGRHQPRLRHSLRQHRRLEPGAGLSVGAGHADRAARRDLGTRRRRPAPDTHARFLRSRRPARCHCHSRHRPRRPGRWARRSAPACPPPKARCSRCPIAPRGQVTAVMALHF